MCAFIHQGPVAQSGQSGGALAGRRRPQGADPPEP